MGEPNEVSDRDLEVLRDQLYDLAGAAMALYVRGQSREHEGNVAAVVVYNLSRFARRHEFEALGVEASSAFRFR